MPPLRYRVCCVCRGGILPSVLDRYGFPNYCVCRGGILPPVLDRREIPNYESQKVIIYQRKSLRRVV
jgi:hypothetical protein